MIDIKYDPELPFAYASPTYVHARFAIREDAEAWQKRVGVGEVIDTRPKPKIPEDADYILWQLEGEIQMAYRGGGPYDWYGNTEAWTNEQLLEEVGDAEVTVLVRRETE